MKVLFYISGHGFGHAVRMNPVIQAIGACRPDWKLFIRTSAPRWLFDNLVQQGVVLLEANLDSGAVEDTPLCINAQTTRDALSRFIQGRGELLQQEIAWVKSNQITLIVADTPWLAGDIAKTCGILGIGIGNFLWSWILEPLLDTDAVLAPYISEIEASYAHLSLFLRLPFSHSMSQLPAVRDVPMVTQGSKRSRSEVLSLLGIESDDTRPLVYWSTRGTLNVQSLSRAAQESPELIFAYPEYEFSKLPANTCRVRYGSELSFADLMSVCDTVIAKPGYGIAAACALNQVNMLYSRRSGFREDDVLLPELARYIRLREISPAELVGGYWAKPLRELRSQVKPDIRPATNGAEICAHQIIQTAGVCSCSVG